MLIVEDGTGLETANCYVSEAELDAYALLRNVDLSGYSSTEKEAAIYISANDFIDSLHDFQGELISASQGMKLYTDVATFDIASKNIKSANSAAAILQLQGLLFVVTSTTDKDGEIKSQQDKLDVMETKTEYVEGTAISGGTYDTIVIDRLLRPYLSYGGTARLVVT